MNLKKYSKKSLAITIVLLFLGMSYSSAFAEEEKTSSDESSTTIYEVNNPNDTNGFIYENTDCFVMGRASEAVKRTFDSNIWPYFKGYICFGMVGEHIGWFPSDGWIYTNGLQGKWKYEGSFYGWLGDGAWFTVNRWLRIYFEAVNGFRGIVIGGAWPFTTGICIFIGHADNVRISHLRPS